MVALTAAAVPTSSGGPRVPGTGHGPATIVIADDDEDIRRLLRLQLRDPGYTIVECADGREALEACRRGDADLALLDIEMPYLDGFGVLRAIRNDPDLDGLPVILLTAHALPGGVVKGLDLGAHDYLRKPFDASELRARVGAAIKLRRRTVELVEARHHLAWRAFHDELTGLPNRAFLADRLGQALRPGGRGHTTVALLFLDLDRFKVVNDSLGHASGDELLVEMAGRIQAAIRPADTVARMGGDEFVVLVEGVARAEDLGGLVERVREAVAQPVRLRSQSITVTVSIGIALADGHTADSLLRDADTALYRAKDRGRNRCELFDEALRAGAVRRLETEGLVRAALDRGGVRVHYQPIVDLRGGVVAVEALARLEGPDGRRLEPEAFLDVAEECGLIVPLGSAVLHEACHQAARWTAELGDRAPRRVTVNISARQLAHPRMIDDVAGALAASGLEPGRLCLELTENALIEASPTTRATIEGLRSLGVALAIDDFGTGYASLAYLKRFPVDYLKIDRSFIAGLGGESEDSAIVRAIISLAGALGLTPVAEGVETPEQLARLESFGCTLVQGHHFGRPQPAGELASALRSTVPAD